MTEIVGFLLVPALVAAVYLTPVAVIISLVWGEGSPVQAWRRRMMSKSALVDRLWAAVHHRSGDAKLVVRFQTGPSVEEWAFEDTGIYVFDIERAIREEATEAQDRSDWKRFDDAELG